MSDTKNTRGVRGRRRKAIRRISIRLTTCDEMTLRRLSRVGKMTPSDVVRETIRAAGGVLNTATEISKATGEPVRSVLARFDRAVLREVARRWRDDDRREENIALSEIVAAHKVGDQEAA